MDAVSSRSASPPMFKLSQKAKKRKPKIYRSVITDIFDGKLNSSVQCLSCDRISTTSETFQDLSLPIPSQEALANSRNSNNSLTSEDSTWFAWIWSWMSEWFYGPEISLQDCLAYFFSADELKGDNMYSCEKCKWSIILRISQGVSVFDLFEFRGVKYRARAA